MFTDGQEHPIEWFDEHLADVYTPVFVDESNFENEKRIGLWIRTDIYAVQDGDEKITYRYYNDDGILIRAETIPVVYNGENAIVFDSDDESEWAAGSYIGELGFRNGHFYVWDGSKWVLQTTATIDDIPPSPKYLGCYTKPPENANEDDWYLNSTNGITYKFDGAEWNAVTDYDDSANTQMFMAEMSDLCALAKNTGESLFLERLCANVAFIGKLFSKNIVMQSGGSIKSENYVAGKSGWQIKSNGEAEFANGVFRGEIQSEAGKFGGYLYTNGVPFILVAMINFRNQDMDERTGIFHNYKTSNIKQFVRREKGIYDVYFKRPIKTKIFKALGSDNIVHNYLTLFFLGNAHDERWSFANCTILTTNYDLISIDGEELRDKIVVDESTMTATVYGAVLYCCDNNTDNLVEIKTIQGFFVGTEPTY